MDILSIAILIFAVLETANIILLYFMPQSKYGNSIGVFNSYEHSKAYPDIHMLIKYLINWVAGTKLIFILLLFVILFLGTPLLKVFSIAALILSILSFYWRLYPIIQKLDDEGQLTPKGYSKTLGIMIFTILLIFAFALALFFLFFNTL